LCPAGTFRRVAAQMWSFKCGSVGNCLRIKYEDVGKHPVFKKTSMVQAEIRSRHGKLFAYVRG